MPDLHPIVFYTILPAGSWAGTKAPVLWLKHMLWKEVGTFQGKASLLYADLIHTGPEPNTVRGGGVWMSGGGIASDGQGSIFFGTGNGYASQLDTIPVPGRQPPSALEEAAVHMKVNDDGTLDVVDFFMPWEKKQLDGADKGE